MAEPAGIVLAVFSQVDTTVNRLSTRIRHHQENRQKVLSITELLCENAKTYEGCRQAMMKNPDPSDSNLRQLRTTHIENIRKLAIDTLRTLTNLENKYFRDEQGTRFSRRQWTKLRCFIRANKIHSTLCKAEADAKDVKKILDDLRSELTIEKRIDAMPRGSTGPSQSAPAPVAVENADHVVLNFGTYINHFTCSTQKKSDV